MYVAVSAAIGDFARSMKAVARMAEDTAKKVKESAGAIANAGAIFAAGMGLAVKAAAETNQKLKANLERIKKLLYILAGDIGDAFAPLIHELTQGVSLFTNYYGAAFDYLRREVIGTRGT